MKRFNYLAVLLVVAISLLASCQPEMTLQRYFLQSQENPDFTLIEVPTSLFSSADSLLSGKQLQTLKSVQKISLLMYRNPENREFIEAQRPIIESFLQRDGFQSLVSLKMNQEAEVMLSFKGEIEQINEAVFFGFADDQGFVIGRILGEEMNPAEFVDLAKTLENKEYDEVIEQSLMDWLGESQL